MNIAFNIPSIGPEEIKAVTGAMEQDILCGDGPISQRVQASMEKWLGVRRVYLTTSCTHALEAAMMTIGLRPGDEVIMPSFTFVSTANAVVLRGATPVFAEISPETLNIDPRDIERRITSKTKAIIPVHYAGVACAMDTIMEIARQHRCFVVEDAAQGIDAKYNGKYLGTLGDIGCYSFHHTKNIVCGEGGAFLTDDKVLAEKFELVRDKGTNRSAFLRGEIQKYTWVSEGSSYVQSDILASILEAQLAKRLKIRNARKLVWEAYYQALRPFANSGKVTLPVIPKECDQNFHIFYFRAGSEEVRDKVLLALKQNGIGATFHYVPLHSSPYWRDVLHSQESLPITEECSRTLVRLPLYPKLVNLIPDLTKAVVMSLETSL